MSSPHGGALRLLFLCLVCIGIGHSMLFSILPPAARAIGLSPFQVSTIFATSATIWVFVSPWWGRRSDIRGRRPIILSGLLGYALSMFSLAVVIEIGRAKLLPAAVVYPMLIVSRSLFALLGSGTGPASQAYVADRTSRSERTAGVALVSAAIGVGETIGPGIGAALAALALLAPLYLSAGLAVVSAFLIHRFLPEPGPPVEHTAPRPPRLSLRDARVAPFVAVSAALQAVRATTMITLAFFLQDTLALSAEQTVQYSGIGFVTFAVAGLVAQLVLVQRFQPTARQMLRAGVPLTLAAYVILAVAGTYPAYLVALALLGVGIGLMRPGSSAGASLSVGAHEQGAVAGLVSGVAVVGNVVGPMLGTSLYALSPIGPYVLNAVIMTGAWALLFANPRLRTLRA